MLEYVLEQKGPAWIVRFQGDLSGQDDKDLRKLFVELSSQKKTKVVADFTKVTFLDSIILGTLVWGMKNLREAGGDWRLFGLQDFVRRLFEITMLDRAFRIFSTEGEAVHSYA